MSEEEFRGFYEKYFKFSMRIVYRIVKDHSTAEDICQEIFYRFHKMGDKLKMDDEVKLRAYILTSAVNAAIDYLRKTEHRRGSEVSAEELTLGLVDRGMDVEAIVLRMEETEYKKMVLRKLYHTNPMNYEIVIKVKYLGISPDEVAREFGITRNNVNNRILRTKIWLAKELSKMYGR